MLCTRVVLEGRDRVEWPNGPPKTSPTNQRVGQQRGILGIVVQQCCELTIIFKLKALALFFSFIQSHICAQMYFSEYFQIGLIFSCSIEL